MSIRDDLFKRLRDPRGRQMNQGWAGSSLDGSISRVFLNAMAVWQGVMTLVTLLSLGLQMSGFIMAAIHLLACLAALAVISFDRWRLPAILGWWALFVVDWAVSPTPESNLLFASCWMCNLNGALPAFLLRGKASWIAPLIASVAVPVAMVLARPDLMANPLVPGVFVTILAITIASRMGQSYLVDYANRVDAEARELEETTASLTIQKSATHQAAEDARVLHDTAINTLGAIASGGAAVSDPDAVRQRCLADIAAIETLHSNKSDADSTRHRFRDAIRPSGIQLRFEGMSDSEIAATEEMLPPQVLRALSRATAEAVQNAGKHSGAEEVVVSIMRIEGGVRVTIADQGVGMQGGQRHGTGISRSILERSRNAGIRATIDSTPGQGTTVTLEYAFDHAEGASHMIAAGGSRIEDVVRQLRSRTAFVLSAGLVGVGIALSALNHPGEATPEWLMTAVVAIACWLAWRERDRAHLSALTTTALLASGPLAFFMSAWAVGFGQTHPYLWQAIGPTGPLLALMIVSVPRLVKILGLAIYILTAIVIAISVAPISREATTVCMTAGLAGIGLIWGVSSFVRSLAVVATRAHSAQQDSFLANLELAAVEAAAETRRRWRDAGVEQSASLLRAIGEGHVDSRDPSIQARCAEEEAFLRQLTLLNPELIRMGTWFARALNASRIKGVGLIVRSGSTDAAADHAPQFGKTLLSVIDAMPAGTKLTTAFFATTKGLSMTLVGPTPHLVSALNGSSHRSDDLKLQTFGKQDFAELVMTGNAA